MINRSPVAVTPADTMFVTEFVAAQVMGGAGMDIFNALDVLHTGI